MTKKSYTDLEQSKKLAEILPIESADMTWEKVAESLTEDFTWKPTVGLDRAIKDNLFSYRNGYVLPCWSLAALLEILDQMVIDERLEYQILIENYDWKYHIIKYFPDSNGTVKRVEGETRVDAAFRMIVYLKENKLI